MKKIRVWSILSTFSLCGFLHYAAAFTPTLSTDVALDIRDMREELLNGNREEAKRIFREGKNSEETLESLSTSVDYSSLPPFLFHTYGLQNPDLDHEIWNHHFVNHANNHIEKLLDDPNSGDLASEAVLVLSMWMRASYYLWDVLQKCRFDAVDNLKNIERFMISWMGSTYTKDGGHGLYDLTERASALFGTVHRPNSPHITPLSTLNIEILKIYAKIVKVLEFDGTCRSKEGRPGFEEMYGMIVILQAKMMIPLVQMLISALMENDIPLVNLFSLAVVPQLSQCKRSSFEYLRDNLLNAPLDISEIGRIISVLQSTFDCLGFSCEEVGAYKNNILPQCADVPPPFPLAGYHPTSNVHQHGKIDLDIRQIKIFCEMGAWDHARIIYSYGKNSIISMETGQHLNYRTLKAMAKTKSRSIVTPFYREFSAFYNDPHYADTIVSEGLSGIGYFETMTPEQRTSTIIMTIQYQILYMYAMTVLERSVSDCYSQDPGRKKSMIQAWDQAAAYMIGSLEGPKLGGSPDDGLLLYQLSNKMCQEFGTCSGNGWSKVAEIVLEGLEKGRNEMSAPDCQSMEVEAEKIKYNILIPVIQSVIWYSIRNQYQREDAKTQQLAEGEAMTRAILPIIYTYRSQSSEVLRANMIMKEGTKPVNDGPQAIADAMHEILDDFGVSCLLIGSHQGVTTCREDESSSLRHILHMIVGLLFAFVTGILFYNST